MSLQAMHSGALAAAFVHVERQRDVSNVPQRWPRSIAAGKHG
jgi:hypothetical protein